MNVNFSNTSVIGFLLAFCVFGVTSAVNAQAQSHRKGQLERIEPADTQEEAQEEDEATDPQAGEPRELGFEAEMDESDEFDEEESVLADSSFDFQSAPTIGQIDLSMSPKLKTPELKRAPFEGKNFATTPTTVKDYRWAAPNVVYKNLLFEEPLLERHGVSNNQKRQTLISGVNFYKTAIFFAPTVFNARTKRCDNPLGWGPPDNFKSCNPR